MKPMIGFLAFLTLTGEVLFRFTLESFVGVLGLWGIAEAFPRLLGALGLPALTILQVGVGLVVLLVKAIVFVVIFCFVVLVAIVQGIAHLFGG